MTVTASSPSLRGGGKTVVVAALGYFVVAAAVAFYLLPVGFELAGIALLASQVAVLLVGAALVFYVATTVRRADGMRAALLHIAAALGWEYLDDVSDRIWGGSIDEQIPRTRRRSTAYLDARGTALPFDSAARTFTVGSGDGARTYATRAVRIPLQAEAPRIVLRSRAGHGALSALPRTPNSVRELRLEGNFSDVFQVSVPAGYERDALYLLTPDLMVILLDHAADLDLEIVDGTLHVYLPSEDLTKQDRLEQFVMVIAALHERFGRRTLLYRDEDAPALAPRSPRRPGDTLSAAARTVPTRSRVMPVLLAVTVPFVPLAVGVALMSLV
ncbi:hypothetical protein [Humibacter albus]|uniref:hypothetical protein n=1 Tax=Humibacter albus TaxID=427754 RepID=UPI0003B3B851|nr:hypothetical protein [Humibacter albus]